MKQFTINRIYFFLIAVFFQVAAHAQINTNLILNSRPPAYLSDWNSAHAGQLIVTNTTGIATPVRFQTKLSDVNGNTIAVSNLATAKQYVVNTNATIFSLDKVLQLENMIFSGSTKQLANSGKLSPGTYQLCVQVYSALENLPITEEQCKIFSQINYQLPYLLTPSDKTWLDANIAQTTIVFRWSGLVPSALESVSYQLEVYEVQEGQQPIQAMRSNQPILATTLRNTTQYIWRPNLYLKDTAGHVFIWTVQTLDGKGEPIETTDANAKGRSEPRVFGVSVPLAPKDSISVIYDTRCNCDRIIQLK